MTRFAKSSTQKRSILLSLGPSTTTLSYPSSSLRSKASFPNQIRKALLSGKPNFLASPDTSLSNALTNRGSVIFVLLSGQYQSKDYTVPGRASNFSAPVSSSDPILHLCRIRTPYTSSVSGVNKPPRRTGGFVHS